MANQNKIRKFAIISDDLVNVFPKEQIQKDWEEAFGLRLKVQATHHVPTDSFFEIVDEAKAEKYLKQPKVRVVEGLEYVRSELATTFTDFNEYSLIDSAVMAFDWELSGKPKIIGFNPTLPLTSQENLKAVSSAGLAGVRCRAKPTIN